LCLVVLAGAVVEFVNLTDRAGSLAIPHTDPLEVRGRDPIADQAQAGRLAAWRSW
jgi:hypothetical protein